MDKIKKRLIKNAALRFGIGSRSNDFMKQVEYIMDTEYKSRGGVIGEFEEWACYFAHDKMFKISHTTNEFVVRPLETKEDE